MRFDRSPVHHARGRVSCSAGSCARRLRPEDPARRLRRARASRAAATTRAGSRTAPRGRARRQRPGPERGRQQRGRELGRGGSSESATGGGETGSETGTTGGETAGGDECDAWRARLSGGPEVRAMVRRKRRPDRTSGAASTSTRRPRRSAIAGTSPAATTAARTTSSAGDVLGRRSGHLRGHLRRAVRESPESPTLRRGMNCTVLNDGELNVCLPDCDPLLQNCARRGHLHSDARATGEFISCPGRERRRGAGVRRLRVRQRLRSRAHLRHDGVGASECSPMASGCCIPFCDGRPSIGARPRSGVPALVRADAGPAGPRNVGICGLETPRRRLSSAVVRGYRRATAMYTLYYSPGSASMLVHLLPARDRRAARAAPRRPRRRGAARPAYLRLNPGGVVPTLIVDGAPCWETAALALLLAERHPEAEAGPAAELGRSERTTCNGCCTSPIRCSPRFAGGSTPRPRAPRPMSCWPRRAGGSRPRGPPRRPARGRRPVPAGASARAVDLYATMLMRWSRKMPRPATEWPQLAALAGRVKARPSRRRLYAIGGRTSGRAPREARLGEAGTCLKRHVIRRGRRGRAVRAARGRRARRWRRSCRR